MKTKFKKMKTEIPTSVCVCVHMRVHMPIYTDMDIRLLGAPGT